MNSDDTISFLKKDILDLYLRTGQKSIENIYIKIATVTDFGKWINSSAQEDLKNTNISNNQTLPALKILIKLFKDYPNGIPTGTVVNMMIEDSSIKIMTPYITSINKRISDFPSMSYLSAVTKSFSPFQNNTQINVDDNSIYNDLKSINDFFESKEDNRFYEGIGDKKTDKPTKETIYFSRKEMFSYLLKRLSNELAQEADSQGNKEFASAIRNGILADRFELYNFIKFPEGFSASSKKALEKNAIDAIKHIFLHYNEEEMDNNYDYLKAFALRYAFALPTTDFYHPSQSTKRTINNVFKEQDHEEIERLKEKSAINKSSLFFNPSVMSFLSMFFSLYAKQLSR